jgi:hypothetical protein
LKKSIAGLIVGSLMIAFWLLALMPQNATRVQPQQQCTTRTMAGKDETRCYPWESWVLVDLHCDSGITATELCGKYENYDMDSPDADDVFPDQEFRQKSDAIGWIESTPWLAPSSLFHEGKYLSCSWTYVNPGADGEAGLEKSVDCMTHEEFEERYCTEVCAEY